MKKRFNAGCFKMFQVLIAAIACSAALCADSKIPVSITAGVSKDKISIGDKFELVITVTADKSITLGDFNPVEELSKSFEVKDFKVKGPKRKSFSKVYYEYKYLLSTFTTGLYEIPELALKYKKSGSEEESEIKSPPIKINVESIKPRPDDKDDIRGLKSTAGMGVSPVWFVISAILLTGILVYTGYKFYARRKSYGQILEMSDARPCDEVAMENLVKLKNSDLLITAKVKEYYIYLSEIIRQYLEKRFGINVLDRTTMELYRQMKDMEIDRKVVADIKALLDDCDLVKFAKYMPQSAEIEKNFQNAVELIEKTKQPRPQSEAEEKI